MAAKANLYYADIYKVGGDKLIENCDELIKLVTSIITLLADYQMDTEKLKDISDKRDDYAKLLSGPRGDISARAAIRAMAESIVANIREHLSEEMDRSMAIIKDLEKEFFAAYTSSRVIVDRHGKRRHDNSGNETTGIVSGKLTDAATGDPLVNVLVQMEGVETAITTDLHGVFVFEGVQPGKHNIVCKKDTYQNLSFNDLEVIAGDELELEGKMKRA